MVNIDRERPGELAKNVLKIIAKVSFSNGEKYDTGWGTQVSSDNRTAPAPMAAAVLS